MKYFISGATGWIGRAVCQRLQDSGLEYVSLSRSTGFELPQLHSFAEYIHTIREPFTFIHCAAKVHCPEETKDVKIAMNEVNVAGLSKLLQLLQSNENCSRFIYLSSISVYGDFTRECSESSDTNPISEYAKSKLEGERLVISSGINYSIIRLATVFGEGDIANFAKLASAIRKKRFFLPGKSLNKKSVIPIDLSAKFIVEITNDQKCNNQIYNFSLQSCPSLTEIANAFAKECDFPEPVSLPYFFAKGLALIGDFVHSCGLPFPFTSKVLEKLTSSTVVDSSKLWKKFPESSSEDFSYYVKQCKEYYKKNASL